ncbi:hypothetical protein C8J56DRAFT_903987 [Mycena floridula]|nr:hypothetical protein C8J56DRAFT_903987 [Mycena floridula]
MSTYCASDATLSGTALIFKANPHGRLGPWNMGAMFAWLLQGILLGQASYYFNVYGNDDNITRSFVGGVMILNIFKSYMCGATLWTRSVDRFGDWNAITHGTDMSSLWEQKVQVLMSEIVCFFVHIYFILRVFRLTKRNWYLLGFLLSCATIALAGGIYFTVLIYAPTNGTTVVRFDVPMTIMLVFIMVCDSTITTTVFISLIKSKTGFNRTDSLISRLVRLTWMSAAPPTLCALFNLALYEGVNNSDTFVAFNIQLSYLASMSMMYTINSRKSTRNGLFDTSSGHTSGVNNPTPANRGHPEEFALASRVNQAQTQTDVKVHTEVVQSGTDGSEYDWDTGKGNKAEDLSV